MLLYSETFLTSLTNILWLWISFLPLLPILILAHLYSTKLLWSSYSLLQSIHGSALDGLKIVLDDPVLMYPHWLLPSPSRGVVHFSLVYFYVSNIDPHILISSVHIYWNGASLTPNISCAEPYIINCLVVVCTIYFPTRLQLLNCKTSTLLVLDVISSCEILPFRKWNGNVETFVLKLSAACSLSLTSLKSWFNISLWFCFLGITGLEYSIFLL